MEKLYRVSVEVELVVVAKSPREAEREAEALVAVDHGGADVIATVIHRITSDKSPLPDGWTLDTLPFCGDDTRTIAEYLSAAPSEGDPG